MVEIVVIGVVIVTTTVVDAAVVVVVNQVDCLFLSYFLFHSFEISCFKILHACLFQFDTSYNEIRSTPFIMSYKVSNFTL